MLDTNTIKNYAFTPSPTVTLGTSTTYWVVAEGDAFWVSTTSTSEDGTPAMGWEIGDAYESRVASSTGNFTTSAGPAFMIRVNGTTRSGGGGGNGGGGNGGGGNGGGGRRPRRWPVTAVAVVAVVGQWWQSWWWRWWRHHGQRPRRTRQHASPGDPDVTLDPTRSSNTVGHRQHRRRCGLLQR